MTPTEIIYRIAMAYILGFDENVAIAFGRGGELSLKYEGRFKKDYADHTGMVNLKVNF